MAFAQTPSALCGVEARHGFLSSTAASVPAASGALLPSINKGSLLRPLWCRYEIRDIMPPAAVRNAMELQAEAERRKRAQVRASVAAQAAHLTGMWPQCLPSKCLETG